MSTTTEASYIPERDGPRGLSGWLILMGIGQGTGPFYVVSGMIREWASLPAGITAAYPAAVLGDYGMRTAYVIFLVYVAYLFFNKRREFPRMFIWTYVVSLALPFAVGGWVSATSPVNTLRNLGTSDFIYPYLLTIAVGGIWTAYVLNSRRVRNTFEY